MHCGPAWRVSFYLSLYTHFCISHTHSPLSSNTEPSPFLQNYFFTHFFLDFWSSVLPFFPPHLSLKCGVSEHVPSAEALLPPGRPEGLFGASYSLHFWLVSQQQWLAFPQSTFTSFQSVWWQAPDFFWKILINFNYWLRSASSTMNCRCQTVFSEKRTLMIHSNLWHLLAPSFVLNTPERLIDFYSRKGFLRSQLVWVTTLSQLGNLLPCLLEFLVLQAAHFILWGQANSQVWADQDRNMLG